MKLTLDFEGGEEMARRLRALPAELSRKVQIEALRLAAEPIRQGAADRAPRDPNSSDPHLADNIVIGAVTERALESRGRFNETVVEVGPAKGGGKGEAGDFFYGCVFDSRTWVSTDRGQRAICQIKVGDRVLTQAGDYRFVLATYRYPATEKPDLVTITARYRKGQNHTLTVTRDHKVLVYRDVKYHWIDAWQLAVGDVLAHRRKTSWSKGTAIVKERVCEGCGGTYTQRTRGRHPLQAGSSQGDRFCSAACRSAWLADHHRGMRRSMAARSRMSRAAVARLAERPDSHPNRIMSAKGYVTQHEKVVAEWLVARGVAFNQQHRIGSAFVDFYLPDSRTVIEADGAFWHRDQQADIERDRRILGHIPDGRIVHMHFVDPRFTPPDLVRQPLPNVVYVPCNPGPSSFVDLGTFEDSPVIALRHWSYEPTRGQVASLYDLTVEGVHSFVASGLVIHNSFQEFGTSRHAAQAFLRPAFDQNAAESLEILGDELWFALRRSLPTTKETFAA